MLYMRMIKQSIPAYFLLILLMFSAGCGVLINDISDLELWIEEVMARPGGRPKPIPEVKPYEAYAYQSASAGMRDPFESFYQKRQELETDVDDNAGLTEAMERELKRNREELEQYELDSLRMKGTLQDSGTQWGILEDPDGIVHRVKAGNYIGRNIGKIINIYEDRIELREIVKNSQGRWEEREAAIALAEVE